MEKHRASFLPLLSHSDKSHRTRDRKCSIHAHDSESQRQTPVDLRVSVSFKIPRHFFTPKPVHIRKDPQVILVLLPVKESEPESQKSKMFGGRVWLACDSHQQKPILRTDP